ncbi:hematopoietic prostaglandin D synthase [Hyla sarda]|uniref:hematopoietic prostaglandin D synthase n=1 Tax=Hyla sarda TaxID=327740 RepID=UPI0024C389EB|nr:hematopoietic prostaglandin D synthase [Hyla sarda]XP_056423427.1 hematopoietic prostaglandin D synthase [Hyla sarda]
MPNYKLTYFNFKGRAEILRYLFAYTNTEFEDHRIEYKDWPSCKDSYPFGKLPVLEIDGTVYYQSLAIGRYLAKKAGLAGKTDLDDLRIDAILDTIDDFVSRFPWDAADQEKKEYIDKFGGTVLSGLAKELGDNKWFLGKYVTWADFFWDICSDGIIYYQPDFSKDYPNLLSLKKRVKELPEIAAWIKRRPQTEY